MGLATRMARGIGLTAVNNPLSQIGILQLIRCSTTFPGASGVIQFSPRPEYYGNPVGTVLPILEITEDKRSKAISSWPTGGPPPMEKC